jgi:hypothetical protein
MTVKASVGIIAILLAVGCSKAPEPRALAVVNGRVITDQYLRDVVLIQARMQRMSGKKVPGEKGFSKWANSKAIATFPSLVSAEMLLDGIEKAQIVPDSNDVRAVLFKYNHNMRARANTPEELYGLFGEQKKEFERQFHRSCQMQAYNRHFANQTVSEEEIAELIDEKKAIKDMSDKIDALGRKNAEAAWQRLAAGEDWNTVAEECSEDKLVHAPNESLKDEWGVFGPDALGYPDLAIAIRSMHVGDFSKPIDIDEGIVIVKVTEEGEGYHRLARMLFRMAEPVKIPNEEEAKSEIIDRKAKAAQEIFLKKLRKEVVVTYPSGTNFNFTVFD